LQQKLPNYLLYNRSTYFNHSMKICLKTGYTGTITIYPVFYLNIVPYHNTTTTEYLTAAEIFIIIRDN